MMRFLAVTLITTASAAGSSTRLRSGALEQPTSGWDMPNRGWNLESQAVEPTEIQSPAEMEEEEETTQEVPESQPSLSVALDDPLSDIALPQAVPKLKVAPVAVAPPAEPAVAPPAVVSAPATQASQKQQLALLEELAVTPVYKAPVPEHSVAKVGRKAGSAPLLRNERNLTKGATHFVDGEAPKDPTIYSLDEHKQCNPPCKANRGVCNDRVCFCKTPYTGTTCQNEISAGSYRFGITLVAGCSMVCVVFGVLCAVIIYSFIRDSIEKRMVSLGDETVNKESWTPSDTGTKKKVRK